jgi:serine/threonine-protein kinase
MAMEGDAAVTQIGKYAVTGILGRGGMGVVYRAVDPSMGREVAIKTLNAATEELRRRFLLEARSGILNHPNIVTVYDFGEQDGNPYIVMEFVSGDSLENMLRKGRSFSLVEKLEIVRQLCVGLGYAHQKGVVHRDIKPANIMVQSDGQIKIVDFGVARLQNQSGQTQTGMVIGTFHYISPERLLGKPATGKADIWSAGVILYDLLTGRLPFPGDDMSTLHRVIHEPHEPITAQLENPPKGLERVIDTALAKNPAERYESADDMASDLEAICEELRHALIKEAMGGVQAMIQNEQWTSLKPVLVDLQRLAPKNTEVKRMLREVQEKLSVQQKSVRVEEMLAEAAKAVEARRLGDAVDLLIEAGQLDPGNAAVVEKLEEARRLKERAEKVAALVEQSRDARQRSNYTAACELIDRALQMDERNTELRNERARLVQEAERARREETLRKFGEEARRQLESGQFTEAIKCLRSALEIDPTDSATQQLYQQAVERQEERRRRAVIEQIVAEIGESITAGQLERALTLIQRALERLPGEPELLQLKAAAEKQQREEAAKKLVEKTTLEVYDLLAEKPQEALAAARRALDEMPGEPQLIALLERVSGQIRKAETENRKAHYLQTAQAAIDKRNFAEALQILESAVIECGEAAEFASLRGYAQEQMSKLTLSESAAAARRDAQALIAAGKLEAAVALLEKAAAETRDPAVEQMLRQTADDLAALTRRVDAIVHRAQAMGERSAPEALQFLYAQPIEIREHAHAVALRAQLAAALQAAPPAQADAPPQQAAVSPPPPPSFQPVPVIPAPAKKSGGLRGVFFLLLAILLAAGGGAAWWFLRPAPAVPLGTLELNATPYAEVVSVLPEKGKPVVLAAGEHWTPMRLDGLPAGTYTVTFKGADGGTQTQNCVAANPAVLCRVEMKPLDDATIEQMIGGAK